MTDVIRFEDWETGSVIDRVTALSGSEYTFELGQASAATLRASRADIEPLSLDLGDTLTYLETDRFGDEFGGRLVDIQWQGERANLVVDSFEKDAQDAEPSGDGTGPWHYENADDSTIITDAIGRVDSLSAGEIETVETGLSFRFSRVSQAKIMRTVESAGDGELAYNPDGSVDYVDSLGRDRTHVTLSEGDARLSGDFTVERAGDNDRKVNKLVMLGSGEGPGQLSTTVTADSFDAATDREKWGVRTNPEISDLDTLKTVGQALVNELATDYVDASTTVRNERVLLGDEYHIDYSPKNVDADLRAAEVTTRLSDAGRTHETTFSNRRQTRESLEDELIKNVRRAGRVIEGFTVPLGQSAGPGWVASNMDFRFRVPYPDDVLIEVQVNLVIEGIQYMDPSGGSISTQDDWPKNCDVKVNGSSLGHSFGDGSTAFIETIDLSGELTGGKDNTIDVTSENLGMIRCTFSAEVYRTMTGGN